MKKRKPSARPRKPRRNNHNNLFQAAWQLKPIAEAHLRDVLGPELLDLLDLDTLRLASGTYMTPELAAYFSDVPWFCNFKASDRQAGLCFLYEHKSHLPDLPIHVQLLPYYSGIWREDMNEGRPLTFPVPIIVYHGQQEWVVKPFWGEFEGVPGAYRKHLPDFEYILTDLQNTPPEAIIANQRLGAVRSLFLAFKFAFDEAMLLRHLRQIFIFVGDLGSGEIVRNVFDMIFSYVVWQTSFQEGPILREIETFPDEIKSTAMSTYEQILNRGDRQGFERAIQNLILNSNHSNTEIASMLNADIALVRKIRQALQPGHITDDVQKF